MVRALKPSLATIVLALAAVTLADHAEAIPQFQDYWRLTCAPNGVTTKLLNKAKAKMANAQGAVESGAATLNYACVQSALETKQFQVQTKQFQDSGGKGKAPVINHQASMEFAKSALAKLNSVAKAKKNDPEAIYYLGLAFAVTGDEWAVNKFDDVIRMAPGTDFAANAQLGLAEFYFDKKGPAGAFDAYSKVLKGKKGFPQSYARYKLSWVNYVQGAQAKNREAMRTAITNLAKLSKSLSEAEDGPDVGLAKSLKEDILAMVIDFGDQAEAQRILKSVGAAEVYATFLDRLAYAKIDAGAPADAYKLFAAELKEQPKSKNNVQVSINMAAIAVQLGNIPLLVGNVKSILATYISEKSTWRKKQKPADLKKSDAQIEGLVFDYATGVDQEGRKDQKPQTLAAADELYGLFLKSFPKSAKAYDARFYDGQLNFVQKKFVPAATVLLAMITENPKGKNTKDGLDIMVTAAQSAIDADKTAYTLPKPGMAKNEIKIPPAKKLYADCLDLYVKYNPRNENAPAMRFASGSVYYDFGHYKDGNKRYFTLIKTAPANPFAKPAAARVFEYFKAQKGDEAFEKVKAKFAAVVPLRTAPELAPYFAEVKKKPTKKPAADVADESGSGGDANDTADDDADNGDKPAKKRTVKASKDDAPEDQDEP